MYVQIRGIFNSLYYYTLVQNTVSSTCKLKNKVYPSWLYIPLHHTQKNIIQVECSLIFSAS